MARPLKRATGVFLRLLFVLLLTEGLLHLVLAVMPGLLSFLEYRTNQWHVNDHEIWGVWHVPDTESTHVKSCASATYHSNAHGMRDATRSFERIAGKPRVAILGDSFVEGMMVDDHETLSQVMEHEVFGGAVEVLNFGTSGHFSTTQQWLVYDHLARKFQPDVVVLAFFNINDLYEISWPIWRAHGPRYRPYLVPSDDGAEGDGYELFYPDVPLERTPLGAEFVNAMMRFSAIARVANEVSLRLKYGTERSYSTRVYAEPPDEEIADAWETVAAALTRLKASVATDGATLAVVQLVDPEQVDPDRARAINDTAGHDVLAPNRRMAALTERLQIPYLSLHDTFVRERDARGLEHPYFGYTCDGHWAPSGHRLAAETLGAWLRAQTLVVSP